MLVHHIYSTTTPGIDCDPDFQCPYTSGNLYSTLYSNSNSSNENRNNLFHRVRLNEMSTTFYRKRSWYTPSTLFNKGTQYLQAIARPTKCISVLVKNGVLKENSSIYMRSEINGIDIYYEDYNPHPFEHTLLLRKKYVEMVSTIKTTKAAQNQMTCCKCLCRLPRGNKMIQHMKTIHNIALVFKKTTFRRLSDFESWKYNIYEKEKMFFRKLRGNRNKQSKSYLNFVCNCQFDEEILCMSFISAKKKINGYIVVQFCFYHNHKPIIWRLKFTNLEKKTILQKLWQTNSIEDTYVYFITQNDEIESRLDCLNRNYIRLLKYKYCKSNQLDPNDLISIKKNIQLLKESGQIEFTFEKYPNTNDKHESSYFVVLLVTTQQDQFLKKNVVDTLMVDSTFGTNQYNYKLITGFTINNVTESVPLFYIISSDEKEETLQMCFMKLAQNYTNLKLDYIMTDLAQNFYNATKDAFPNIKWRWCEWHFLKSIGKNIIRFVKSADTKNVINERIKELTTILDKDIFQEKLVSFVDFLQNNCENFASYFNSYYSNKSEYWSLCNRLNMVINVNMICESFFGYFKRKILKNNKRNRVTV